MNLYFKKILDNPLVVLTIHLWPSDINIIKVQLQGPTSYLELGLRLWLLMLVTGPAAAECRAVTYSSLTIGGSGPAALAIMMRSRPAGAI